MLVALAAFTRLRILWGAFDFENDPEGPAFDEANTVDGDPGGTAALRRCVIRWNRSAIAEDIVQTSVVLGHVSDANVLVPWETADFTAAEAALDAFWTSIKPRYPNEIILNEYRWYREGPGADPPEVTVRVTPRSVAGTSTNDMLPGQIRDVVSLRTALRKRWGRMYLPTPSTLDITTIGQRSSASVDTLADYARALAVAFGAANLGWFVYSPTVQRGYTIERVWVDNSYDTQRSGKQTPTYHKAYPV